MIDRRALGEPGNIVIENDSDIEALKKWAAAGKLNGSQIWMQINHPGKQAPRGLNSETVAPSAIGFGKKMNKLFSVPRELTHKEIKDLITRFGRTAGVAKVAGFDGVQIHGAHGYLVSQFLSPYHNQRTDQWGGSPANRQKFMLEVLREIRERVGKNFPIGIKLNSADFQRGGFTEEDSIEALKALEGAGIDLIEISGGTYEAPVMTGSQAKEQSTLQREAYFLEFAEKARKAVKVPLMLTGGFRTASGMASAIRSGAVDLVGLGRSLAVEPDLPSRILIGSKPEFYAKPVSTGFRFLDRIGMMEITWYTWQIQRMARGRDPIPDASPLLVLLKNPWRIGSYAFRTKRAHG
jgi:2,4-dienoyl-CoA reductase-like NADH-dependent reductase (Old Yellow Enzyme family)